MLYRPETKLYRRRSTKGGAGSVYRRPGSGIAGQYARLREGSGLMTGRSGEMRAGLGRGVVGPAWRWLQAFMATYLGLILQIADPCRQELLLIETDQGLPVLPGCLLIGFLRRWFAFLKDVDVERIPDLTDLLRQGGRL